LIRALPLAALWAAVPAWASDTAFSIEAFRAMLAASATTPSGLAPGVTVLTADRVEGRQDVDVRAEGQVSMLRDAIALDSDRARYDLLADELDADGNVHLKRGKDTISGPSLRLKLDEMLGRFDHPEYRIERTRELRGQPGVSTTVRGSGSAEALDFEGENQYRLRNATFTTCESNDPAWYLKAKELSLDYDTGAGTGSGTSFHFQGLPFFYTPVLAFPLDGERRSGFLPMTIGQANTVGVDITLPYYFNLAPNYDDTFAPRLTGRRGLQLNNEFRHLSASTSSSLRTDWLPQDAVYGSSRSLISLQHLQNFGSGFSGRINYNAVSDPSYFADLSSNVTQTSTDNLVREGELNYSNGSWFTASALTQRFQTLVGSPQYNRLPQLRAQAWFPDWHGFSLMLPVETAQFRRDEVDQGWRSVSYPQLQYSWLRPDAFITPKIGLHLTDYSLSEQHSATSGNSDRAVPIASLDSGLFFDREVQVRGRPYVQTLEPRLYYLYVPYRNQDGLPVFDSGVSDFGFSQIFSENLFSGQDRIANANQLTAAVTSRLIRQESGAELGRASIGTRFYFDSQRVAFPGAETRTGEVADILGSFSGQVLRDTRLDLYAQYNPRDSQLERATFGVRYQPDNAQALSLSYRYKRDDFRDIDLTAQWPLGGGFYGVGRINGDVQTHKLTQAIAGVEYNGGCWVLRLAAHSLLNTTGNYTNAYFLQFEFGGVVSVGNSPVSLLERSVVGYGRINQSSSSPVFGRE
jgi:LPS-assembly protein